ncbi:hypothetical protein AB6A23_20735 [Paenibacillus tarimensis]
MKRNRTAFWLIAGIISFLLILIAVKMIGFFWQPHYVVHGHGRGFHRPFPVLHESYHSFAFIYPAALVSMLLKLGLLILTLVLWAKSTGVIKWVWTVLAGLVLMSLLTPFWGLLLILALVLINRRRGSTGHGDIQTVGYPGQFSPISSRGHYLDEWERKIKEDK